MDFKPHDYQTYAIEYIMVSNTMNSTAKSTSRSGVRLISLLEKRLLPFISQFPDVHATVLRPSRHSSPASIVRLFSL